MTISAFRRRLSALAWALCAAALGPGSASAQIGIYDALASRFSDVSFYGHVGDVAGRSDGVTVDRLTGFGIEVLLEIGRTTRIVGPPAPQADSVELRWTGMEVLRDGTGAADTINTYDVVPIATVVPRETIWTFELGVGYGQLSGFESSVPGLELKGSVRDLPTVSLYASYEPTGTYFGLRSGFMKFQGLQVFDAAGESFQGSAEGFMAGAALGQAIEMLSFNLFVEGGYAIRPFPSIEWSGGTIPAGTPRDMSLHGWNVAAGIQFSLGSN